jgi:hypothetical protein
MKNALLAAIVVAALALTSASNVYAKEATVIGKGSYDKLHETLIKVHKGDKTITYHLVNNAVTKAFRDKVSKKPAQVKAKGDLQSVNGRLEQTPKSIELVKAKQQRPPVPR